jgi:hypothetical protein
LNKVFAYEEVTKKDYSQSFEEDKAAIEPMRLQHLVGNKNRF